MPAEEVLLVERHQEDKQTYAQGRWPRRADVYVYRYADDTLIRQVYNMDTNQVDQVDQVLGVQLPLTEAESQRALAIALADATMRPQLNAEFRLHYPAGFGFSRSTDPEGNDISCRCRPRPGSRCSCAVWRQALCPTAVGRRR